MQEMKNRCVIFQSRFTALKWLPRGFGWIESKSCPDTAQPVAQTTEGIKILSSSSLGIPIPSSLLDQSKGQ